MPNKEFYNVTTAAIIFNPNCSKVLLIQRQSDESFPSMIAFPGGRWRKDEVV